MVIFRRYTVFIILGAVFLVNNCTRDVPQTTPPLTRASCYCHDYSNITQPLSNESAGPREWMDISSNGLIRTSSLISSGPLDNLSMQWQKRGRHPQDLQACGGCHKLTNGTQGHSLAFYPPEALSKLYEGGVNCAGQCHTWLSTNITTGTYTGSIRPETLLQSGDLHSQIYYHGYNGNPSDDTLNVYHLPSGCGACHNYETTRHGFVPTCLNCHNFVNVSALDGSTTFTSLHTMHSNLMPGSCNYCHVSVNGSSPSEQAKAVCYNCHLSGHAPSILIYK